MEKVKRCEYFLDALTIQKYDLCRLIVTASLSIVCYKLLTQANVGVDVHFSFLTKHNCNLLKISQILQHNSPIRLRVTRVPQNMTCKATELIFFWGFADLSFFCTMVSSSHSRQSRQDHHSCCREIWNFL